MTRLRMNVLPDKCGRVRVELVVMPIISIFYGIIVCFVLNILNAPNLIASPMTRDFSAIYLKTVAIGPGMG